MFKKTLYLDLSERKILLRVFDVISIVASLWLADWYTKFSYMDFYNPNIFMWLLVLIFYIFLFGQIFQLYSIGVSNNRFLILRSIFITTLLTTFFYVFTPYFSPSLPKNRIRIIHFFLLISIPLIIWRFIYTAIFFNSKYVKNIILIAHSSQLKNLVSLVKQNQFYKIVNYVSDKKEINTSNFIDINQIETSKIFDDYNTSTEVVVSTKGFSDESIQKLNKKLIFLFEKGINIKGVETYYQEITNSLPKEYLDYNFYKNIHFSKNNYSRLYLFFHRIVDFLVSVLGSLLFVVITPFVFVGNLIGNYGPFFYSQERVGKKGKVFKIFKLRTMIVNAEKDGAVWAKKKDSRITSFGRFLRLTRIDEIPQFYNILKGDMSLIGPRPERPEFVKDLKEKIPFYAIRHVVKPGLTGWAQVNYPYANTIEEQETKLRYDLYYIKNRNAFLDFKILIKTITTVLFFRGQ